MAECFNIYIEDISCNGKGQIENLALLHILKGDTGDTGLSAYELALQIGFISGILLVNSSHISASIYKPLSGLEL